MPFTFSHPAIVLPATGLHKKYYSLSGLLIGSMVPDFEYFIRMRDYSKYSHTISGMFWFDIPLGIALLFLFHNVVRNILIRHLPYYLNTRFSVFEKFNWNEYFKNNTIIVIISLLFGIASHLFWDSFTHDGEFFASHIPLLSNYYDIFNHEISGAGIFQYVSSLLGGIVMLLYVFSFPEGPNTRESNILYFWLLVSLITLMVLNIRLYLDYIYNDHHHEDIIVTIISGGLIGVTALSLYLNESYKKQLNKKLEKIRNKAV